MKYAHIADCHIGSWRDPKLRDMSTIAFEKAINICISECVDFVLIAGDLFNTALPGIDNLKRVFSKLKELKHANIPLYYIAGSHDFSPTGKTMLDLIEEAELGKNVVRGEVVEGKLRLKFTIDEKTGAKITGLLGKKGMLERVFYENLDKRNLESEEGYKIFMFHTTINEMKPKHLEHMEGNSVSFLPKGFDYYAGGHVHIVEGITLEGYTNVHYPGPLFPNSFSELEKLRVGTFNIVEDDNVRSVPIELKKIIVYNIDAHHKSVEEIQEHCMSLAKNCKDAIVLLRLVGKLSGGKSSDIDFKAILEQFYTAGAYFVMRNTAKLVSEEFEEIKIREDNIELLEEKLIQEHIGQITNEFSDEADIIRKVFHQANTIKQDGEKVYEFEERVVKELDKIFEVE